MGVLARLQREIQIQPKAIMVDENGPSYHAINQVLGIDFVTSKVVNCQMH